MSQIDFDYFWLRIVSMKKFFLIVFLMFFMMPSYAYLLGLEEGISKTYIGSSKGAEIIDAHTGKVLYTLKPMMAYVIRPYKQMFAIKIDRQNYQLETNSLIVRNKEEKSFLATKKRWYRGEILFYNFNNKITVINRLPLEDYLLGVVPAEMPYKWNYEAHKAQAIAARSYAVANIGKHASHGYDLTDTPKDQAYGGVSAEKPQTTRAVRDTKDIVITYNNKVISAYYHSSSGGFTKGSAQVWGKNLPYIHAVKGYDDNVKKNGHGVGMSQYGANNLANQGLTSYQILNYFYKNIHFANLKTQL